MRTTSKGILVLLAGLNFIFIGQCTKDSGRGRDKIYAEYPWTSASDTVTIQGSRCTISGKAFRVFGPRLPGVGLVTLLNVTTESQTELPPDVRADSMWIADKDSVWVKQIEEINQHKSRSGLSLEVSDGPTWQPGDTVNIVVGLRLNDTTYFLSLPDLRIEAHGGR